jgi:hypothetical protein
VAVEVAEERYNAHVEADAMRDSAFIIDLYHRKA